jgi:hypothetical protein
VSLIARGLEGEGIPTALVSVLEEVSGTARPPRQVIRKLNIGATVGRPNDTAGQLETLRKMVSLIDKTESFGAIDRDTD